MSYPRQAFIFHPGKYYVRYPADDSAGFGGGRSMCMPYSTAKDYAEIFGGTVHRDPRFLTFFQQIQKLFKRRITNV